MPIMLVSLKTDDGKGSALLACTGIKKDPVVPDNRILENVVGLAWPYEGTMIRVSQWSVNKKSINHWMIGDVVPAQSLTMADLEEARRQVPRPPGTVPEQGLANDQRVVQAMLAEQGEATRQKELAAMAAKAAVEGSPGEEQQGSED